MANSIFIEGLIENNISKLLAASKSDLHNHSTKVKAAENPQDMLDILRSS